MSQPVSPSSDLIMTANCACIVSRHYSLHWPHHPDQSWPQEWCRISSRITRTPPPVLMIKESSLTPLSPVLWACPSFYLPHQLNNLANFNKNKMYHANLCSRIKTPYLIENFINCLPVRIFRDFNLDTHWPAFLLVEEDWCTSCTLYIYMHIALLGMKTVM